MNLLDHPELADRLAAAYGLGTLRGGARRRFEQQARQSPALRAAALAWQERFAGMTELQPRQVPSRNLWKRIETELAHQRRAGAVATEPVAAPWRRALGWWWRGAAFAGGLATAVAVGMAVYLGAEMEQRESQLAQLEQARSSLAQQNVELTAQMHAMPEIRYIALLSDEQSAASILVTFDPAHNMLTLKRLGEFAEGPDKSLQLWALPPSGGPRSLGVLGANPVVKLTAAPNEVQGAQMLAVSLEPKGGVPGEGGPTGPVMYKGPLMQTP